ncbi:hypothetical protein DEO72_LG6g2021 [Vigna unguiculata]|uniref:Uncharacterized protein n=1 Tax=Vigna unguiculata TaxID=3917 RepID=A0A4D6MA84_VIGUN|nr:hypothetical protein DEO72_LG6g2021 [Vigna unguiculata]
MKVVVEVIVGILCVRTNGANTRTRAGAPCHHPRSLLTSLLTIRGFVGDGMIFSCFDSLLQKYNVEPSYKRFSTSIVVDTILNWHLDINVI